MSLRTVVTSWILLLAATGSATQPQDQQPLTPPVSRSNEASNVSIPLYNSIEELSRLTDIAYCVPFIGISPPFQCPSHCADFPSFELITAFGPILGLDSSCTGYLAYDHDPKDPRLVVAFRGTYSLGDTISDLFTAHQTYAPYKGGNPPDNSTDPENDCRNCTVHGGFLASYQATREKVISAIDKALLFHRNYRLTIAGHSLGGAIALLLALELQSRGVNLTVTTFGQPAVGNLAFAAYVEKRLLQHGTNESSVYRRITHKGDPVPGLPWKAWGFAQTAGEYYIAKDSLPHTIDDVRYCADRNSTVCYEGQESRNSWLPAYLFPWEYVSAHRDYFHRLGLCLAVAVAKSQGAGDERSLLEEEL